MKTLMAHFWLNSCNSSSNFTLLFALKDTLVFVFMRLARCRSLVGGDHQDYMQFGNHENNSGHCSDKFFFLGRNGNEMNVILFFSSNKSDRCGREEGAKNRGFKFISVFKS